MAEPATPITGRCLCGRVTYSADAAPVIQGVCHCTDCQRQTGSPYTVFVGVPLAAFTVQGDTLASYATTGDHGGETERKFCSACGAPVYSIAAVVPELALIKAGSLDDASWVQPAMEVYTGSAQPWTPHFEQAAQFERTPG